MKTDRTNIY